ncbi:MerR family transcriptional regulator [Spiractinospora alimapuensis]|nr:MerR family transcriptional regulator [Spiractinospora alimapuensis]
MKFNAFRGSEMRITMAAERAGVSARALRYYEEEGLLRPERSAGGHREYSESSIDRIRLILRLRSAGLDNRSVRMALSCVDSGAISSEAINQLRADRNRLTSRIVTASQARDRLDELISSAMQCSTDQRGMPGA